MSDARACLLRAAVGFAVVTPTEPELRVLHQWLDCWRGAGDVGWTIEGVEYENVFTVDLENDDLDHAAEKLGMLHRSAILKGEHEDYLRQRQALSPASLARALFSYDVLTRIRRHVRKREGLLLDVEDLAAGFRQIFSAEARERIGVIRVQRKKRVRKKAAEDAAASTAEAPSLPPASAGA